MMEDDLLSALDGGRISAVSERYDGGEIRQGAIETPAGEVAIRDGVARFVPGDAYAGNFGLQWNTFRQTQLDSHCGAPLTFNRFWNNTKWKPRDLVGKTVLEAGSGAGRFSEVLLDAGVNLVSFDLSSAVDANWASNRGKGRFFLSQASIYEMPFKKDYFDYVFCYGVLQHTPEPERAYRELFARVKPGGKISIDYYLKTSKLEPWSNPKYFWRRYTKDMEPEKLLRIIRAYIPYWLPIDTFIKKLPKIGNTLGTLTMIPCWNYHFLPLTKEQKREWAIMDTFDALGATYDYPKTLEEVRQMVTIEGAEKVEVFYGSNGVVANVTKGG